MKYQLVVQLPEAIYGDIDLIADMEDSLENYITNAEVDGHDLGSGEVNIFIHTSTSIDTFEMVKEILKGRSVLEDAKMAYRNFNESDYICLSILHLSCFFQPCNMQCNF